MKKLIGFFVGVVVASSVFGQIRVTGEMPDSDNVYNPPKEVTSDKKSSNSLAGLYRLSSSVYTRNHKTHFTTFNGNYMMNIVEVSSGTYLATVYGHRKYYSKLQGKNIDSKCGKPSVLMFTVDNEGKETSRKIIEQGECKFLPPSRYMDVGWNLENDVLITTRISGDKCVVGPCRDLNRVINVRKFDKTN